MLIDDLGLALMSDSDRRDLLEILEDRHGVASTIVTSQLPLELWHDNVGDPTLTDAILDRLLHHSRVINIKGHSYRLKEHTLSKQLYPKQGGDAVSASPP